MASFDTWRIGLLIEMWGPLACGALSMAGCLIWKDAIHVAFVEKSLSLTQLNTGLFGWASVMTGFLFGVYSVIIGKSDGFIEATRETRAMALFLRYASRAVTLGFVLTLCGIPLLVANTEMKDAGDLFYIASSLYFGIFVWSFAATARVAWIFAKIVRVKTVNRLPG